MFLTRNLGFQELARLCWPVQSPITLNVPSSESLALNWCRSSSVKDLGWSESCSLWLGKGINQMVMPLFEAFLLMRNLFELFPCREHAPSIIFMDEIDSIGSSRIESGSGGGDSEVQRTMLELLNQLDGFSSTSDIKVGKYQRSYYRITSELGRPRF